MEVMLTTQQPMKGCWGGDGVGVGRPTSLPLSPHSTHTAVRSPG